MISPHLDRAEAIRLINEIGMADVWMALTFDIETLSFRIHSQLKPNDVRLLVTSYVFDDEELLKMIKEKL